MGYFLPFYPPKSPKNQNLKKMKKSLEISSFYICVPKIIIRWRTVPEIWCAMDRHMDRWKKWHTEVSVPPKNMQIQGYISIFPWKYVVNRIHRYNQQTFIILVLLIVYSPGVKMRQYWQIFVLFFHHSSYGSHLSLFASVSGRL